MNHIQQITGIQLDYTQLPRDYLSSIHPEAVKFRRAYARANNAIEGVILSHDDKRFMDSIPLTLSKEDFKKAVLHHIQSKRA